MANVAEEEIEYRRVLGSLHFVQFKFCRKIRDLKALKSSVKNALAQKEADNRDYSRLEKELERLDNLGQEYEASVNAFNFKFGWKENEETVKVNKVVDENLAASRHVKVTVEMLMRQVKKQLEEEELSQDNDSEDEDDAEEEEEKVEEKIEEKKENEVMKETKETKETMEEEDIESEDNTSDQQKTMSIKLRIAIGLIIVLLFYSSLGIIIKVVQDNKKDSRDGQYQYHRITIK